MGQTNESERKINNVSGIAGQVIMSQGPDQTEIWSWVDYGLAFLAEVTTYTNINNFKTTNLVGLPNDYFSGPDPYYVFVLWDAGGAGAAPQGEMQPITDFVGADGSVEHGAFSAILALTDLVLIIHPRLADTLRIRDVDDKVSGILVQVPFFAQVLTVQNDVVTIFEFDALGCTIREINISLYLPLHATATLTPTWEKTRAGDLVTFVAESIPAIAGVAPVAATYVRYHCGEIAQGLQGRLRVTQSDHAVGVTIDAYAILLMEL